MLLRAITRNITRNNTPNANTARMNILVTGASRGIGYELGKLFAQHGAKNIFLLSRDEKKLKQLKKECSSINPGAKIHLLPFSLTGEKNFDRIRKEVMREVKRIDILVNNAGYLVNKPFEKITRKDLEKVYDVNVFGPFLLTQALLGLLGGKKRSHVVNIGSMGGVQGQSKFAGLSAYTPSKMAIAGLSECLAEELKEKNISVNCLAIGAVNTEMMQEAFPGYKAPHSAAEMAAYIAGFSISGHLYFNGKIIPVAVSVP